MRGRTARAAEEADVDLTPMLDVVFILLIFFIVTSNFIQEETLGIEGPPPPSPQNNQEQVPAIIVRIAEDNLIRVNGRLTDIGGVRANMERLRAENPQSALIIQAHPLAPAGTVVRVRDQAYNAKMDRVNVIRDAD